MRVVVNVSSGSEMKTTRTGAESRVSGAAGSSPRLNGAAAMSSAARAAPTAASSAARAAGFAPAGSRQSAVQYCVAAVFSAAGGNGLIGTTTIVSRGSAFVGVVGFIQRPKRPHDPCRARGARRRNERAPRRALIGVHAAGTPPSHPELTCLEQLGRRQQFIERLHEACVGIHAHPELGDRPFCLNRVSTRIGKSAAASRRPSPPSASRVMTVGEGAELSEEITSRADVFRLRRDGRAALRPARRFPAPSGARRRRDRPAFATRANAACASRASCARARASASARSLSATRARRRASASDRGDVRHRAASSLTQHLGAVHGHEDWFLEHDVRQIGRVRRWVERHGEIFCALRLLVVVGGRR